MAQRLPVIVACSIVLLFAVFLGWNIGENDYAPLLIAAAAIALASIALFSGPYFWVFAVASSFLTGTFPILGGQFTPFQILTALGIAKFIIEDIVFKHRRIRFGDRLDLLLIAGFMGILTIHGIHDRFGMRFLGSSVWGGHNYVNVYVGFAAYFVVQSISLRLAAWSKLPLAVLGANGFDLLIAILTWIVPASIYIIFPFYSAVSSMGVEEIISGEVNTASQRVGAAGNFGAVLTMLVLASISIPKLIRPAHIFRFGTAMIGFFGALYSGYRSMVLNTLVAWLSAGIRDLKFRVLALLPIIAGVLFGLSIVNSQLFHLPKTIQRGLAFLPGEWDVEMAADAAASNDFRARTWELWQKSYFPVHPWIGRGFGFRSEWSQQDIYTSGAVDYPQMVETGNIHNGLFATVDTFGVVGTIAFALWNFRILVCTFRIPSRTERPGAFALRFLAILLCVKIVLFWGGAGNVGSFLPGQFALVGVFLGLQRAFAADKGESAGEIRHATRNSRREIAAVRT